MTSPSTHPELSSHDAVATLAANLAAVLPAELSLAIELAGRPIVTPRHGAARFTIKLSSPEAALRLLARPAISTFAEAYIEGDWDVAGDVEAAIRAAEDMVASVPPDRLAALLAVPEALQRRFAAGDAVERPDMHDRNDRPERHGRSAVPPLPAGATALDAARRAISYHYDLPVAFWRLWLDDDLLYTCGYHHSAGDDVHTAQRQKLARIAGKIRLADGDRVLDIGCGWGGFLLHAARRGAQVTGITLSEPQAVEARRRIAQAGVAARATVELCDFREYRPAAPFDAGVAIGLLEHLGEPLFPAFFDKAFQALRPGGVFLVQAIAVAEDAAFGTSSGFIHQYVFPDGRLEPIATLLRHAERAGFEVRDVESLRDHYLLTMRQWLRRLEDSAAAARELVGDARYRAYRAYLAGFANEFRKARMTVYQTLLQKVGPSTRLPLVRDLAER